MNDFTKVGQTAAETVNVSKQALVDSFTQAWSQVILLAPKVVAMAVVLVVGYVVARWVGGLIGVIAGMLAIGRIGGSDPRFRLTALAAGLACPSLVFALHLGQWSGLYVGLAGLVVYGWCEREETLAGVAASTGTT